MSLEILVSQLKEAVEIAKEYRSRYLTAKKKLQQLRKKVGAAVAELEAVASEDRRVRKAVVLLYEALESVE